MKKTITGLLLVTFLVSACNISTGATSTPEVVGAPLPAAVLESAGQPNAYWVTNPTSGARLYTRVYYPPNWNGSDLLPALVLMPGGIGESDPQKASRLTGEGFLVIIFDADGRGRSEGMEDYNGSSPRTGWQPSSWPRPGCRVWIRRATGWFRTPTA